MGGSIDVVSSALDLLSDVPGSKPQSTPSNESKLLRAERQAQEVEQKRKEELERRHKRENVTEARERQRHRLEKAEEDEGSGQTTLINGGAGLTDAPDVATPKLKEKFGE